MNTALKSCMLATIIASTQVHALNPVQGWYAGLTIGPSIIPTVNATVNSPINFLNSSGSLSYSVLGEIGGQIGYRCNNFRGEIEGFFDSNPFKELTLNLPRQTIVLKNSTTGTSFSMNGSTQLEAGLFNIYYDFFDAFIENVNEASRIVPYIGIGGGYANVKNQVQFYYNSSAITEKLKHYNSGGAAQGIVGATYFMDDFSTFSLDFRYFSTMNNTTLINSRTQLYSVNLSFNGALDAT